MSPTSSGPRNSLLSRQDAPRVPRAGRLAAVALAAFALAGGPRVSLAATPIDSLTRPATPRVLEPARVAGPRAALPGAVAGPGGAAPDLRGPLALDRAIDLALGGSAGVQQRQYAASAELNRVLDETHWGNPTLEGTLENFGPSNERAEQTVTLSQPLPLGGRIAAQRSLAGALRNTLPLDVELARREWARQTGEAFVESWWLEQRIALLRRAEQIDAATIRSSEERTRAGAAPITEALRARATLAEATIDRRKGEADLFDARLKLAQTWGARTADFDTLVLPPPPAAGEVPGADTLIANLDQRPEIRRAAGETAIAEARLRAARAEAGIEWSVLGGVRHLNEVDQTLAVAGVSAGLPVWNRHAGLVAAADAEYRAAALRERILRLDLERRLASADRRARVAAADYALARDEALPAAREALQKLAEGYRAGRYRYLDYLDGQRAALDTELAMLDAVRDYWNARLAIEWGPPADAGADSNP